VTLEVKVAEVNRDIYKYVNGNVSVFSNAGGFKMGTVGNTGGTFPATTPFSSTSTTTTNALNNNYSANNSSNFNNNNSYLLYTHINPNRTAQDALRPLTPQPLHPLSPTPLHINNGHPPHSWNLSVNYHDPHTVLLSPHLRPHHSPDICPSSTKDGWSPYTTQSMTSATSSTYGNNTYSYISTTS
jgi:hypothetical protein